MACRIAQILTLSSSLVASQWIRFDTFRAAYSHHHSATRCHSYLVICGFLSKCAAFIVAMHIFAVSTIYCNDVIYYNVAFPYAFSEKFSQSVGATRITPSLFSQFGCATRCPSTPFTPLAYCSSCYFWIPVDPYSGMNNTICGRSLIIASNLEFSLFSILLPASFLYRNLYRIRRSYCLAVT